MGTATVVDQLIVKLGLDPREFEKGQKRAAASLLQTQQQVKKSVTGMDTELTRLAKRWTAVAIAIAAVKKGVDVFGDLATDIRQLGNDSKAFNISANMLRNWQNVAEMMGGKAEDVTRTVGNLTKAVFDLAYNGQVSESIVMLTRLGVRFQDATGQARDFTEIVFDTEAALQRLQQSGSMSSANAYQAALQAGFDPGLARAIVEGRAASELSRQENRRQVTRDDVDDATALRRSVTSRDQALEAAKLAGLDRAARMGIATNETIEAGADIVAGSEQLDGAAARVREAIPLYDAAIRKTADVMEWAAQLLDDGVAASFPKGRAAYEDVIQSAARQHKIDPEMLAGLLATESNFDPSAVNPRSGARGIAQLMPKYFPDAGKNPDDDIRTAASELARLRDLFMNRQGMNEDDAYYHALQAYNAGRSRVLGAMTGGDPLAKETVDYPGKVLDYARADPTPYIQGGAAEGGGRSTTNRMEVGKIEIHTQASDADGIARNIVGATARKFDAAQSDAGMN